MFYKLKVISPANFPKMEKGLSGSAAEAPGQKRVLVFGKPQFPIREALEKAGYAVTEASTVDELATLEKGQSLPVGTTREWGGIKYRKTGDNQWVKVSGGHEKAPEKPTGGSEKAPDTGKDKSTVPGFQAVHVEPEQFVKALGRNLREDRKGFVTFYSAQDYKEMNAKCYTSPDGKAGYSVTGDGDIISVFNGSGKPVGEELVKSAVANKGTHLDCLGSHLMGFYGSLGFEVTERIPWDDQYASPHWNAKAHGKPDVIVMRLRQSANKQAGGNGNDNQG